MVTDRIIGTSILDEDIEGCVTIKTFCNCVWVINNSSVYWCMLRIIVTRQIIPSLNLQPWIAIKGSGSRQMSHEKAHTKKANSHKEAQKGRHFDNKLEIHILFTSYSHPLFTNINQSNTNPKSQSIIFHKPYYSLSHILILNQNQYTSFSISNALFHLSFHSHSSLHFYQPLHITHIP